jgi:hypothetical protein
MTGELPQLNTLWIGESLHPVHQLCLTSALYHGHKVRLFTYNQMRDVPEGVEIASAEEVLPKSAMFFHAKTGSPAPFADRFRIKLIGMGLGAWIDTDILFVKPLKTLSKNIFGWEDEKLVGNAILGIDPASELFATVSRHINDDFLTPPWWNGYQTAALKLRKALGLRKHVGAMPYGTTGPDMLTWALRQHNQLHLAQPRAVFYPLPYAQKLAVFRRNGWTPLDDLPDDVTAIHLWFQGLRGGLSKRAAAQDDLPPAEPGSLLHDMARRLGVRLA